MRKTMKNVGLLTAVAITLIPHPIFCYGKDVIDKEFSTSSIFKQDPPQDSSSLSLQAFRDEKSSYDFLVDIGTPVSFPLQTQANGIDNDYAFGGDYFNFPESFDAKNEEDAMVKMTEDEKEKEKEENEESYIGEDEEIPVIDISLYVPELEIFYKLVESEAGIESYECRRMVACVVMNRLRHPSFPDTLEGVIYADGAFAVTRNGALNKAVPTLETIMATNEAYFGTYSTLETVLYFRNNHYFSWAKPYVNIDHTYFSTPANG